MKVINDQGSRLIKAWVGTKADGSIDIEDSALVQAKNLARLPFLAKQGVALMPDVHSGKGSTVGSVIATVKAVVPAAVGVDIGCGMVAVRTSMKASDLPESLAKVRGAIESVIPLGAGGVNGDAKRNDEAWKASQTLFGSIEDLVKKHPEIQQRGDAWVGQLGSLGSGNHFIELCIDEAQDVWIMLHSGSRGFGNRIGTHFIEKAMNTMDRYFIDLPDRDLAYLVEDTKDFDDYVAAVAIGQEYAFKNRELMLKRVIEAIRTSMGVEFTLTEEAINCHHNYIERENHFGQNMWVTRKGAIQAREGTMGIIPGSMGQKSYIVRGKGNKDSYCSCSHGAGRSHSRSAARRLFNIADLEAQTQGVECRKDDAVLDEIPSAYKNMDLVMENQKDLVEVVHTLKAVLCVKGA